jgi:SAM-dependent methyltransferase
MIGKPLLVAPALEKGRGGGHLNRSLNLGSSLLAAGREAFLYIPPEERTRALERIGALAPEFDPARILSSLAGEETRFAFIILDRFKTPRAEFRGWSRLAPLIGIDEGGPCRASFEFLFDLLPGLPSRTGPNLLDPTILPLPQRRGPGFFTKPAGAPGGFSGASRPPRILVSFGAEDRAGLRGAVLKALEGLRREGRLELHAPGAPLPMLREHLAEYDLLITHFGLTAFEALHTGTPVLLLSPGACHEKLARKGGFVSAGIGPAAAAQLPRHIFREDLQELCGAAARRYGLDKPPKRSLGALLAEALPLGGRSCPGCGHSLDPAAGLRFRHTGERSYRRCPSCGLISMIRWSPAPVEYGGDYFFGFYKKQYGKTYLEDFPHLEALGKGRLRRIRTLLPGPVRNGAQEGRRLLDIGCAYGPFLKAALEQGFSPLGIEPAEEARRYVAETLGIPCLPGFFPGPLEKEEGVFDVVSLWYVIEHFEDLRPILRGIHRLLKPGGVLAFSTPSFSGVSGRKSLRAFLEKSPPDHWTIWSPGMAGALLRRYGFRVKKILPTGHHPERFPFPGFLTRPGGAFRGVLLLLSRIFRLGDTFEVYGIKKPRGPETKGNSPLL